MMLKTILNSKPPPKFVIIQDVYTIPGKPILHSIIQSHLDLQQYDVHYFAFENNPNKIKNKFISKKFNIHDFLTDFNGWLSEDNVKNFNELVEKNKLKGVIIIDSLSQFILQYGLITTYQIIYKLINQPGIIQVATILHEDTLINKVDTLKYINQISTITLKLNTIANKNRVDYLYKKPGGKIINKMEEYYFQNNILLTKDLEKIDPKSLLNNTGPEQLPENMSTFKISLDETEKKSREQLNLPYIKSNVEEVGQSSGGGGGNVIYNLDADDDWDEEDPDDDLDI